MSSSNNLLSLANPQLLKPRADRKDQLIQSGYKAVVVKHPSAQSHSHAPVTRRRNHNQGKMSQQILPEPLRPGLPERSTDVASSSFVGDSRLHQDSHDHLKALRQKKTLETLQQSSRPKPSISQTISKPSAKAVKLPNPSPYQELQKGSVHRAGVGLSKSESEEKLNEWSQIFSIQNSRWDSEFDGVKARLMQKLQAQDRERKFLKSYKQPEKTTAKKSAGFVIPNEYLSLEKRSVQPGLSGLKEKLRRDKLKAKQASRRGGLSPLARDPSLQTIAITDQHQGRMKRDLSAQPGGFYSNLYAVTPNSVSMPHHVGQTKNSASALGTQLPSIYAKNDYHPQHYVSQKHMELSQSIGSIQLANDPTLSKSSLERARGRAIKHAEMQDSLGSINLGDSTDVQNNPNLYADFLQGKARLGSTEESRVASKFLSSAKSPNNKRFLSSQSPREITRELKKAFREHPDANPFQLMMDQQNLEPVGKGLSTQHQIQLMDKSTRSPNEEYLEMRMSQDSRLSPSAGNPISINLNININNYNAAEKTFASDTKHDTNGPRNSKVRVSRRKVFEPLRVVEKKENSRSFKGPTKIFKNDPPESLAQLQTTLGEQEDQLQQVAKFCNVQIDNQIERERVKAALSLLTAKLEEKGLTLRDVVDAHYKDLERQEKEKYEGTSIEASDAAHSSAFDNSATRNDVALRRGQSKLTSCNNSRFASLDYIGIIECSSNLQPLIAHQQRFKAEKKKFYEDKKQQLGLPSITQGNQESTEALDVYEKTVDAFIQNLQTLIKFSKSKIGDSILSSANLSQLHLVEEPEMYASSSGESKYSEQDRNYRDHLLQNFDAIQNSLKKFKIADKIVQKNQMNHNEDSTSHLVTYFNEISNKCHIPKGLGMIHRKDEVNSLNMKGVLIDEIHANALANGIGRAKFVDKIILRNCGMTDKEGIKLIKSMNRINIRHLDISENPLLTHKFYDVLCDVVQDGSCQLERLECEDNGMGDKIVGQLIDALLLNGKMVYLNLSKNNITDVGARSVARLIQDAEKLRLLLLHYNKIMGFGGIEIADAISMNETLQVFDISFNSICGAGIKKYEEEKKDEEEGKDGDKKKKDKKKRKKSLEKEGGKKTGKGSIAELFAQGFSEPWANAYRKNKSLLHVDMSHNHIPLQDVEIIADGLKDNHKILGFHFSGNAGYIDDQGFMHPQLPYYVSESTVFTRMQTDLQGGIVNDSRKLEFENVSNCWICEGWSEVHFTYEPGVSDDNPNHDVFKPIDLHLELDHYKPDLMLPQKRNEKVYEVYRMLPPGSHKYFFRVAGQVRVAKDQKIAEKPPRKQKKMYLDLTKSFLPGDIPVSKGESPTGSPAGKKGGAMSNRGTPTQNKTVGDKVKKSMGLGMSIKQKPEEEKEVEPDFYEMDLPKVNIIENIARASCLFNSDHIYRMHCEPRPGPKFLGNREIIRTPWNFQLSCFKLYKPDTKRIIDDCFELDWSRIRLPRAITEDERVPLKAFIKEKYKYFRETYKFQAGVDPLKDLVCINNTTFSAMCQYEMGTPIGDFVDMKTLKLSDVDLEVIAANAVGRISRLNPQNYIIRHNFLEIFIRLCLQKYVKSGAGGEEGRRMSEGMKIMFERDLYPCFSKYDSHRWRKEKLWVEEVDLALKHGLPLLKEIYKKNTGKSALPGAPKFMSLEEFTDLIVNAKVLSDNFGAKQIASQWNLSIMTQVDEIDNDRHLNMTFVEFLEALVRVAERLEIPSLVDDEGVTVNDDIDQETRDIYAKRDLPKKVESLILFLIKVHRPRDYNKHVKQMAQLKDDMVWANDIETGPMKLQ